MTHEGDLAWPVDCERRGGWTVMAVREETDAYTPPLVVLVGRSAVPPAVFEARPRPSDRPGGHD